MKRNKLILSALIFSLALAVFITGCGKDKEKNIGQVEDLTVQHVYPLNEGDYWKYAGKGNEYADFEQKVIFKDKERVQLQVNNGGTKVGMVYQYKDGKLMVVYSQEELYEEENLLEKENQMEEVILAEPIEVGNSWTAQGQKFEIISLKEKVVTPAGEFDDCIKITAKADESEDINNLYYKPGLGLVKQEFIVGESKIVAELEEYKVSTYNEVK